MELFITKTNGFFWWEYILVRADYVLNVLSESAGRAFPMLVSNLYKKVDVTWSTYSKMYKSKLVPMGLLLFCFGVQTILCY